MTYVVANLYGKHESFEKLLKKIHFKDTDVMYVLGNIVDFGGEPMELVNDLSTRYNVYSILGEHDYRAYLLLSEFDRMIKEGGAPSASFQSELIEWVQNGGAPTLEGFKSADADTKEGFLEYLSELPVFEEADIRGKQFVLTCRGINDFDADTDVYDYELESFIYEESDFDVNTTYYKDKTMVVGYLDYGNTPDGLSGKIIKKNNNIAVCCDMSETDAIVCYCLETGDEYYV